MTAAQIPKSRVVTISNDRGNKFTKIALIVLGIVLVITISEVAYYLYSTKKQPPTSPALSLPSTQVAQPSEKAINVDKVMGYAKILKFLKPKEGFFEKATVNLVLSGIVTEISSEKEEIGNVEYVFLIRIRNPENNQILTCRFTAEEIANAHILLTTLKGIKKIEITDIKSGDGFVLEKTVNLLDLSPHSIVNLKISRE
jgi:hypothetical protein